MVKVYKFEKCGCEIQVLDEKLKDNDGLPSLYIDYHNLPNCPIVWEMLANGNTKGVFQLESPLGQTWSKKIKPGLFADSLIEGIDEMAALISLIRPGCLNSIIDGKSLTQHYADRKAMIEPAHALNQHIDEVLSSTFQILTFQEQAMAIAVAVAGFNQVEADTLRKAIGKKKPEIMAKVKTTFIEGCKKVGKVSNEDAETIFGWIQESQKYSFNKSHGVGYGKVGYWTAYAKAHFPLHFYCSWLYFAKEKMKPQSEVASLVVDAKMAGIKINVPSIKNYNNNHGDFNISGDSIYAGIRNIKDIGVSEVSKLIQNVSDLEHRIGKPINKWTWYQFLVHLAGRLSSTCVNNLISVGGLDCYNEDRQQMIYEYNLFRNLSAKEREYCGIIAHYHDNLYDLIGGILSLPKEIGRKPNARRAPKVQEIRSQLRNVAYSLTDTEDWIIRQEKQLLGTALTFSKIDTCDTTNANTTCREFYDGKAGNMLLAAEITRINEYTVKRGPNEGKPMAYLTLEDSTGSIDAVIFSEAYAAYHHLLYEENTIIGSGIRGRDGQFIINKVFQAT